VTSSLRIRLLAWYALVLGAVLVVFALVLLGDLRHTLYEQLDAELVDRATTIANAVELLPDGSIELDLPGPYLRYFQDTGPSQRELAYYTAWRSTGELLVRSNPERASDRPAGPLRRTSSGCREVVVAGPSGILVLVGKPTSALRARLWDLGRLLAGAAVAALLLALLGAAFVTGRALAPIARISAAAAAISESNLSQRIDVAQTENELERLAQTLNAAFDRIEAAFARQTRFTADASHELRTPLTIVISQAELALRRERSTEDYREALATILRAARRMQAVVEGLLTLARADVGQLKLKRASVDLRRVIEETAALLTDSARERGVTIKLDVESHWLPVDEDRLREVLLNLLSNAVRYNHEGGRVEVRLTAQPSGAILLEVSDTGIGIAPDDQPHIFERFYRVDRARSREQGGSGLGLAISKWVVEAHGGTIGFESEPGVGTTFRVTLPTDPGPPGPASLEEDAVTSQRPPQ
jgi:two-component system, OmpR family, sensor kinase